MKHGNGVWKGIHNDSYIGEWKYNKADGYGVYVWKSGKNNYSIIICLGDKYEG